MNCILFLHDSLNKPNARCVFQVQKPFNILELPAYFELIILNLGRIISDDYPTNQREAMFSIEKCATPDNALLKKYLIDGSYVDCYCTEIHKQVSFSEFILAFYTTPLFKLERFILKYMASKPSTDMQAKQLADGAVKEFAAWYVEGRAENEILMCDFSERTRSWLMVAPGNDGDTRLYFGSAVVPIRDPKTDKPSMGFVFQALLGFHKIYSVLLLYSGRTRIKNNSSQK